MFARHPHNHLRQRVVELPRHRSPASCLHERSARIPRTIGAQSSSAEDRIVRGLGQFEFVCAALRALCGQPLQLHRRLPLVARDLPNSNQRGHGIEQRPTLEAHGLFNPCRSIAARTFRSAAEKA